MPKPDKPPWQGKPPQRVTLTATLHNLPDTCAITSKVGINANLPISEARDTCAITGRNFVSANLPIQEARDTCLIQGNITFKTTASLTPVQARDGCSISGNIVASGSDWISRSTAPGVFRAFALDSNADLGGNDQSNFGTTPGSIASPTIDHTLFPPGTTGSLYFPVPSNTGANPSGSWFTNFSANLATQFRANSEFYMQVRIRWNSIMANQFFLDLDGVSPQAGIKFFDVNAGDQQGGFNPSGDGITRFYSSADIKVVTQTYYQQKFPIQYRYYPTAGTGTSALYESTPTDFLLENQMPAPQCLYTTAVASNKNGPVPGCFTMPADEWVTFKQWIKLGALGDDGAGHPVWLNSESKLWIARENQQSQLIVWWRPGIGSYAPLIAGPTIENQGFGKAWLLPYMTNRDPTQTTAGLGEVRYGQLILSTQDIADPAPSGNATLLAIPDNTVLDLGPLALTPAGGETLSQSQRVVEFSGMTNDESRQRIVLFGGGHTNTNYNAINCFDLTSLTWVEEYPPSQCTQMSFPSNYDTTNGTWVASFGGLGPYPRPVARHTLNRIPILNNKFYLLCSVEGNAVHCGIPLDTSLATAAKTAIYDLTTQTWSWLSTTPLGSDWEGVAYDPQTGLFMALAGALTTSGLKSVNPTTGVITLLVDPNSSAGSQQLLNQSGAVVPNTLGFNNSLVYNPVDTYHYYFSSENQQVWRVELNRSNLTASIIRLLTTTGTFPPAIGRFGVAYDSRNLMFGTGPHSNKFYTFNPVTQAWSNQTVLGGTPGDVEFSCIAYNALNNVYIIVTYAFETWAYKWRN